MNEPAKAFPISFFAGRIDAEYLQGAGSDDIEIRAFPRFEKHLVFRERFFLLFREFVEFFPKTRKPALRPITP